jgi:hypothetical protein
MVPTKSVILFGLLLFGSTTAAVAQGAPMEVSLKHSEVSAKAESVDHSIDAISLRCDKCDALVKKEINGAKQEAAGLKRLLEQLREITNAKFVAVAKACK